MANPLEELRDMTLRDLINKLNMSDDEFEEWLKMTNPSMYPYENDDENNEFFKDLLMMKDSPEHEGLKQLNILHDQQNLVAKSASLNRGLQKMHKRCLEMAEILIKLKNLPPPPLQSFERLSDDEEEYEEVEREDLSNLEAFLKNGDENKKAQFSKEEEEEKSTGDKLIELLQKSKTMPPWPDTKEEPEEYSLPSTSGPVQKKETENAHKK